jgi:tetratricopeptide (TPR) repeat protein
MTASKNRGQTPFFPRVTDRDTKNGVCPRFLLALALVIASCAETPSKPAPAAPQITEESLRTRANEQLAQGIKQYQDGEFDNAVKTLGASLEHGLLSKVDASRARKYLAFSHCVSNREAQCRAEFRKAFEINPEFALGPAEDGHPIWGPVYRNVRTQLIAEREATVRKPSTPLDKPEQTLADGMLKYDSGDYAEAQRLLESAFKLGLKERADQVKALKHLAFTQCLADKYTVCRATFVKIYDIDENFDLTPAEAGHPSWTKTFAQAKAQAKKALADKAAKEKAAKEKAAPVAPVTAPKKS